MFGNCTGIFVGNLPAYTSSFLSLASKDVGLISILYGFCRKAIGLTGLSSKALTVTISFLYEHVKNNPETENPLTDNYNPGSKLETEPNPDNI